MHMGKEDLSSSHCNSIRYSTLILLLNSVIVISMSDLVAYPVWPAGMLHLSPGLQWCQVELYGNAGSEFNDGVA